MFYCAGAGIILLEGIFTVNFNSFFPVANMLNASFLLYYPQLQTKFESLLLGNEKRPSTTSNWLSQLISRSCNSEPAWQSRTQTPPPPPLLYRKLWLALLFCHCVFLHYYACANAVRYSGVRGGRSMSRPRLFLLFRISSASSYEESISSHLSGVTKSDLAQLQHKALRSMSPEPESVRHYSSSSVLARSLGRPGMGNFCGGSSSINGVPR